MMRLASALFLGVAMMTMSACTTMQQAKVAAPAAPQMTADEQLTKLFADSDEASLKRNPLSALFRGDMRYADHLGDFMTDAYFDAERKAADDDMAHLLSIDRSALTPTNKIAYDVFKWQTAIGQKGLSEEYLALSRVRPLDHFYGFQTFYPDLASGQGAAPFKTVEDYDNNIKRTDEYLTLLDRAIGRFREGMASGVVHPKLIVNNMIEQFDGALAQKAEDSPFYAPIKAFPAGFSDADKARLTTAYAAMINDRLFPEYRKVRDFLKTEYLPVARDGVGLVYMKGGAKYYDYLIESNTTLPLKAEDVHTIGLAEVARIKGEMEKVKAQTGFKGTLQQFFTFIRTDPRFQPKSAAALRDGYIEIGKRVDARVREQFSTIPITPLEIRPVPAYREKTDAAGSYNQGSADGTRPGIFYYNTYDLPSRTTPGMETLYLHEAVPGHHFQISLAQENKSLPAFMRFGGNTAYVEGWALYAETLWKDLGMETDPYQRYGGLDDEMLRAMRLVVDTGIHAKGWTRDQAIKYMLDNSSMGETDARSEVERYIAIPGQALAYKTGQMEIQKLKARAKEVLGAKFDPREFHAQVLDTGALPLTVLDEKIDSWLAARR